MYINQKVNDTGFYIQTDHLFIVLFCRRADENENTPILLNLENVRRKKDENLPQIRTNPPSPQCFSEIRGPNKTTPSKASKSRLMVCC